MSKFADLDLTKAPSELQRLVLIADSALNPAASMDDVAQGLDAAARLAEFVKGLDCRISHLTELKEQRHTLETIRSALFMTDADLHDRLPVFTAGLRAGLTQEQGIQVARVWREARMRWEDASAEQRDGVRVAIAEDLLRLQESCGLLAWQADIVEDAMQRNIASIWDSRGS